MRVLITGGAGYIGTELIRALSYDDTIKQIIVYDNFSRKNYGLFIQNKITHGEKIKIVEGDILDIRSLNEIIKGIDAVIHLAAKVSTPYTNEDPHSYDQINHWGTAEVVYAVESSQVSKFIYVSSTAIYGFSDNILDENSEIMPTTAYALSKYRAEGHVKRLLNDGNKQVHILRSGNVFGFSPSMRFEAVINRFCFESKYLNKIHVSGSGRQMRPFIDIMDIAEVIKCSLSGKITPGIYNVFDDNLRISDIVEILKGIFPEMEMQYLNQHFSYGSLRLKENPRINDVLKANKQSMKEKMEDLIHKLSFQTSLSKVTVV